MVTSGIFMYFALCCGLCLFLDIGNVNGGGIVVEEICSNREFFAVTSRGFGAEEMKLIAGWLADIINDFEGNRERITNEVIALCEKFPIYE